jgi:hypothetical protein
MINLIVLKRMSQKAIRRVFSSKVSIVSFEQ